MLSSSSDSWSLKWLSTKYKFRIIFTLWNNFLYWWFMVKGMVNTEKLGLWITRWKIYGIRKWSSSVYMPHTLAHWAEFLTALLANSPIAFIVAVAQKSLWKCKTHRRSSKQNPFTAAKWGFIMVRMKLGKHQHICLTWICGEIHWLYACHLTALVKRTKSFWYYIVS